MRRALRAHAVDVSAIIGLCLVALAVGGYILANQRLRFPWEGTPLRIKAEFSTAQAVVPGQGQTVRVSGVRIGDVERAELRDGRALVTLAIDPEHEGLVRQDATALLRPKTGLKDMFVELQPGSRRAPEAREGFVIPVRNTLPDVNPDEILAALDADTRDHLGLLISGLGQGLKGRDDDLREVLRRFEPTHRDLARVSSAVAARRGNLRRLVTSLERLTTELAGKGEELSQLVDASASVFGAFAAEQANVTSAVGRLPGALRTTTRTLGDVETYARELGPAARELVPLGPAVDRANEALTPLALSATPVLRDEIRPWVRASRPLARELRAPVADLARATPKLTRSFVVLNHLFDMLGHNRGGREGPDEAGRDEGYLFWIAWLNHIGTSLFSTADAHGSLRPVTVAATCSTLKQIVEDRPEAAFLQDLTGALFDPRLCGELTGASSVARALRKAGG